MTPDAVRSAVRTAALPLDMARCRPSAGCSQRENCARAAAPTVRETWDRWTPTVDASICLSAGPCPMFIDRRGLALRGAA